MQVEIYTLCHMNFECMHGYCECDLAVCKNGRRLDLCHHGVSPCLQFKDECPQKVRLGVDLRQRSMHKRGNILHIGHTTIDQYNTKVVVEVAMIVEVVMTATTTCFEAIDIYFSHQTNSNFRVVSFWRAALSDTADNAHEYKKS